MKPGECAATIFADPSCIIAEVRNYSDPQCCPMSTLCRPMFEIFVSQYIEICMEYIPPSYQRPRGSTAQALCKSHFSQYYRYCNAASEYVMLVFKATILNKFEKKLQVFLDNSICSDSLSLNRYSVAVLLAGADNLHLSRYMRLFSFT